MSMDFHKETNQYSYTSREADQNWIDHLLKYILIDDKDVLDIGCGGGIYSKALSLAGAKTVTAMDYSNVMLEGARENCKGVADICFKRGNALDTNLDSESYDIVLERALIHHIDKLQVCFKEAHRLLSRDGIFIIQDRTPEDCLIKGDKNHIRGYFFEKYPQLINIEVSRRHKSDKVKQALLDTSFTLIYELQYWERRKTYSTINDLEIDLLTRKGRSILHELNDEQLKELVNYIKSKFDENEMIEEKDRWSIWIAKK